MSILKVDILLPLYHNPDSNGKRAKIEGTEFLDTYKDLVVKFCGCTVDPTTLLGSWIDPKTGKEFKDENTTYWIVCDETVENIEFLQKFKETLKTRFKQEDIMMYSISINKF